VINAYWHQRFQQWGLRLSTYPRYRDQRLLASKVSTDLSNYAWRYRRQSDQRLLASKVSTELL